MGNSKTIRTRLFSCHLSPIHTELFRSCLRIVFYHTSFSLLAQLSHQEPGVNYLYKKTYQPVSMASVNDLGSLEDSVLVLPPDVSASAFREMLLEMAKVVGNDNVTVHTRQSMKADEDGHYYNLPKEHDLFYVLEKEHFLAGAVVCPGSTEEVSAVVKLANKYLTPLWPVSIGRNLGNLVISSH